MNPPAFGPFADLRKIIFLVVANRRTEIEKAAGHLILPIQREWNAEAGTAAGAASEAKMYRAHDVLQACKGDNLEPLLDGRSVAEFLGARWVASLPSVDQALHGLEAELAFASK